MSITDPITTLFLSNRGTWILVQGRETFYNEDREMLEFPGQYQAKKYCEDVLKKPFGMPLGPQKPKQGRLL